MGSFNWGSGKPDEYRKNKPVENMPWKSQEHDQLIQLRAIGLPYTDVSDLLGRTPGSLASHMDHGTKASMNQYYDEVKLSRTKIIQDLINETGFTQGANS